MLITGNPKYLVLGLKSKGQWQRIVLYKISNIQLFESFESALQTWKYILINSYFN